MATGCHVLALTVIFALQLMGIVDLGGGQWAAVVGVVLGIQVALWLIPHRGWDRHIPWDPHYLYVPMAAAALLFGLYIYLAPETRFLQLMVWFVALLFSTGLLGFTGVVALGGLMTVVYLADVALLVASGADLSLPLEVVHGLVFFGINVYAGIVLQRLRNDRTKMKDLREELARQAVTDPLTGLPNRRYLEEFLEAELARIRRYDGQCALAMIDVDDFKEYNDTLGHVAGDRVLQKLADVFRDHIRVSDVVARYGGEEFGLIMVNTDRAEAMDAAERLRQRVEREPFDDEDVLPSDTLTVSLGIATCPDDAETYRELLKQADEALYAAKRRGKNRVCAA